MSAIDPAISASAVDDGIQYVTVTVGEQLFGIPIDRVRDVFVVGGLTPVPLAPPEIRGLVNLRGRVVTAVCMRRRLGLPAREEGAGGTVMAVGLEQGDESFGLIVDGVGEVLRVPAETREPRPPHLGGRWASLASHIHRLDDRLLVVLDVDAVLAFDGEGGAS
ncbi:chemotaxis protein CheW [Chelatococcus daeguensis]|uniref:Chemotaxis protein CheW n=2 Tax=Chelatococcus TaxID=28209 RepID=A0AAC9JUD5_9HYPH|nr:MULTISPECIES: chemotaxis protein CheW [Chelatococcus]APF38580.1 chemotaxis protein CheW [Chelatococcus daeguensis]KZE36290.1 chemotaxis protein CheW [Chelatococcus daeguensis]MBM3084231.1 chemotaxis protein CheW [Chelatococcus daeguensis]CUA89540.1 Chemotaxis signal transduction protein [Chelatococcus sambhunathii]